VSAFGLDLDFSRLSEIGNNGINLAFGNEVSLNCDPASNLCASQGVPREIIFP